MELQPLNALISENIKNIDMAKSRIDKLETVVKNNTTSSIEYHNKV